jgi:hypothetical protein
MSNIRTKISHLTTRKVPALSLVLIAVAGMAVGVFAGTIATSTSNNAGGEQGLLHTTSNVLTIADSGLSVVSVVPSGGSAPNASSNFLTTGNKNSFTSATTFVVGHWAEAVLVTDTSGDTAAHAVKITINSGTTTAPSGSTLVAQFTYTMTGVTGSTTPSITLYIDLGVTSITSPLNIYVSST